MEGSEPTGGIVNIAGYRFVALPDRDELRQPFRDICESLGLAGTVLLSHEGINFFLAGSQSAIDSYLEFLEQDQRLAGIPLKVSYSDTQPFRRMLVRLKTEIISLGRPEISPADFTGEEIAPQHLKAKLDADEDVVVLDTRNEYEIRIGTFEDAVDLNISSFRDFPDAINNLPEEMKEKEIIMFCTGGIRCEIPQAAHLAYLDALIQVKLEATTFKLKRTRQRRNIYLAHGFRLIVVGNRVPVGLVPILGLRIDQIHCQVGIIYHELHQQATYQV